jgi:hypothetical protein
MDAASLRAQRRAELAEAVAQRQAYEQLCSTLEAQRQGLEGDIDELRTRLPDSRGKTTVVHLFFASDPPVSLMAFWSRRKLHSLSASHLLAIHSDHFRLSRVSQDGTLLPGLR